jgi:hypothetical protein
MLDKNGHIAKPHSPYCPTICMFADGYLAAGGARGSAFINIVTRIGLSKRHANANVRLVGSAHPWSLDIFSIQDKRVPIAVGIIIGVGVGIGIGIDPDTDTDGMVVGSAHPTTPRGDPQNRYRYRDRYRPQNRNRWRCAFAFKGIRCGPGPTIAASDRDGIGWMDFIDFPSRCR